MADKYECEQMSLFDLAAKKTPIQIIFDILTESGVQVIRKPHSITKWTKGLFISIAFEYKEKKYEVLQATSAFGLKDSDLLDLWDGLHYIEDLTVNEILSLIRFWD
ncbi:MAG: hypothetical protein IJH64_02115 [Oscillospiraceae bacterium]|nr:hypothetical protein [Oscillospiraceae bacterium]